MEIIWRTVELTESLSCLRLKKRPCKFGEDEYKCLALIIHLVITIIVVVDWRMNLLNEVVVLTTPRLSEDILRPTHYETNLKQGAHTAWPVPVIGSCQYLTHAHSHITRAVAVMDSCFALIGAHQHSIAVIVLSL